MLHAEQQLFGLFLAGLLINGAAAKAERPEAVPAEGHRPSCRAR